MKCHNCGVSLEIDEEYSDFETCVECNNNFCEDCLATNVDDTFCKKCAEEITGFTEEEREIIKDSYYYEDVFEAARECGIEFSNVDEAYNGEWDDDEEFVEELLTDIGDLPRDLPCYIHIDWERTARDIMMDYVEHGGHYFRVL